MDMFVLQTKEQLDIFVNPQRQRQIRRFLEEKSRPASDADPFSYALLYCAAGEKQ